MIKVNSQTIIGIDTGNYNVKTANTCFVSGYKQVGKNDFFEDKLCYDGRYYVLTKTPVVIRDDKSGNEDFLILSMFAIAKELEARGIDFKSVDEVVLGVGLPPGKMAIMDYRENLEKYYEGSLCFTYKENLIKVDVKKVLVFPQCYSTLMWNNRTRRMQELEPNSETTLYQYLSKEAQSLLIDIGGGTVDVVSLEYGKMTADDYYSLDLGLRRCILDVNRQIEMSTGEPLGESFITNYLQGKNVRITESDRKMIDRAVDSYIDSLIINLESRGIPIRKSYVVLMGGNAELVWGKLKNRNVFGYLDILPDISANAKGYEGFVMQYIDSAKND